MKRRLRLIRPGDKVPKKEPHFNIRTLQRKTASALHHIAASGYENFRYPKVWVRYLRHVLNALQDEANPSPLHELVEVEQDLEAIEAGMIHMNITTRPAEILFLPRALPAEMIDRLDHLRQKLSPPPAMEEVPLEHRYNLVRFRKQMAE